MIKLKETIILEVKQYIEKCGGSYSSWYVGIASDPKNRLFVEHNVNKENGLWILRECQNSNVARQIEKYFVNTLGADGGAGGGDETTKFVYAYKKTVYTTEQ